jgi:predicted dehydrogenase
LAETIRVGIVGAGGNTRARHIPGLRQQPGVEIVSVANRAIESGRRAAAELGIPRAYADWRELVEADDTDAVCIGTWPYMHCPVTLAALEAGKHVLCEARMAMNAAEARQMLAVSRSHPALVCQVVPAPMTLAVDEAVCDLIAEGRLGDILAIEVRATAGAFIDCESPMHWRQDADLSGFNTMTLGIVYEELMRWVGPATCVAAFTKVCVPRRRAADGRLTTVLVPDHVDVIARMACGAVANMRFSAVTGLRPQNEAWLFGSEGVLRVDLGDASLMYGRRGDSQLTPFAVPQEKRGRWRVEEEFVNAIGGKEVVRRTTFEDGVRYMEFTEAVARSAQAGLAIALPLG